MRRPAISRPATILAGLFVLLAVVQLAARTAYGVVLHDQAEMVLFAQDWRWTYDEQVPLYAWTVSAAMRSTGWALWTLDAIKLAFVGLALLALYRTGRALGGPRAGLIAALGLFLLPTVYDDVLREATHSTAAIAFAALSFMLLVPAGRARPSWGLAFAWAGGLLAKPNVALVIASQLGAAWLTERRTRHLALAALLAVLLAAPAYLVLAANLDAVRAGTAEFTEAGGGGGRWRGLGDLAGSVLAEGALLLVLLAVAYGRLRARGDRVTEDERLMLATVPLALAGYAVIVLAADVGTVRDRWLAPSLVALCPVAAAWLARGTSARAQRVTAGVLSALLMLLVAYRAGQALFEDGTGQGAMQARPYAPVADVVAAAGVGPADAVLFADDQLAATVKVRHPGLRVYGGRTRHLVPEEARILLLVGTGGTGVMGGTGAGQEADWTLAVARGLDCAPPVRVRAPYRFGNPAAYEAALRTCAKR